MKRILYLILFFAVQSAQAQICEGDSTLQGTVFHPSVLPAAITGETYDEVIQIRTVKDSMVLYNNVPVQARFDSIVLRSVGGLPQGFTYACGLPGCVFVSDQTRCVKLSGVAQAGQEGLYPLTFYVTAYVTLFGSLRVSQEDSITSYSLLVSNDPSVSILIPAITNEKCVVFPNPGSGKLQCHYFGEKAQLIQVRNITGQFIAEFIETETIELENYPAGLYYVELYFPQGIVVRKQVSIQKD